jgi:hypothetical protein
LPAAAHKQIRFVFDEREIGRRGRSNCRASGED